MNLAPAEIRKSGSAFDLPITLGILAAPEQIPDTSILKDYLIMGEFELVSCIDFQVFKETTHFAYFLYLYATSL